MTCTVKRVEDFEIDGTGKAINWSTTEWMAMPLIRGVSDYSTQIKVLYSKLGLYCLVDCTDERITSTGLGDQADLWTEDVVEVFLWPDESQRFYLEYEISPLNAELMLLIPNSKGAFMGWAPWHYDGERKVRKATSVRGGEKLPGAAIRGWTAEFFIPFSLMRGFHNTPPTSGTKWRGNFYRIDYDRNETWFAWTKVEGGFHEIEQFGTLVFE